MIYVPQLTLTHTPPFAIVNQCLSTGYGLLFSTKLYGNKQEKKVFHEYLQDIAFS